MNRDILNANIKVGLVKLLQSNHDNVRATGIKSLSEYQTSITNISLTEKYLKEIRIETEDAFKGKH